MLVATLCTISAAACEGPVGGKDSIFRSDSKSPSASSAAAQPSPTASEAGRATLRVGTETLTAEELWRFDRDELLAESRRLTPIGFRGYVEQEAAKRIGNKVTEMLLYQRAALRLGDGVDKNLDNYIDAEIRKLVTAEHGGVQRRYEKHLESQGQTLEAVRAKMRREIVIAGFLEAEIKPRIVEPTRADLMAAYETSKNAPRENERRRMSLIDVRVLNQLPREVTEPSREETATARERARSKIGAALQELQSGTPFPEVARRYSNDLHTEEGGSWGWVGKGSVRERFEPAVEALYRLPVAGLSEVIEVPDGFFLVRCDEISGAQEADFVSLQPELKAQLNRQAYNQKVGELIEDLRKKSHVDPAEADRFYASAIVAGLELAAQTVVVP